MTWRPIGEAQIGDVLVGFDELPEPGRTRKLRKAIVEAVWWSRKPTIRLVSEHAAVTTTAEHRWLQARDFRWSTTGALRAGDRLRHIPVVREEPVDDDYRVGYVAGLSLGDGTFRYQPGWRSNRLGFPAAYWRIALIDDEPLVRVADHLQRFGVEVALRPFDGGRGARRPLRKIEVRSLARLAVIHRLLTAECDTRSYRRGFLAGFFDAEGHSGDVLRISQLDLSVLERVQRYAASLGFPFRLEVRSGKASTLRLVGRLVDRLRFFAVCRPAIARKMHALFGREMNLDPEPVRAVEPGPLADVVDIQTSTGTFLAAGLATHNCYARPSHEYLGFSAGLDFERRIMVKPDAPALLRTALASPRWEPQVVMLSGNTDCYQPVERKLALTRGCLEVFTEFRNPVSAITKSALVARDADLFAELARHGAASVMFSVTTLDPELARRMEPRAARPDRRLEALATLARAGVPVGVMIGPVIPGLNDAEIPRILEAAARAGAMTASWVLVRLAKPLDELFDAWLAEHSPERRERVLARIRETRGGRISDTRFFHRQRGNGEYAEQIAALFTVAARKHGLDRRLPPLSADAFRRPARTGDQLRLL
ncbi:MAG TPA: PA0069 family radical SAM protein [Candidatus Binatia bacterium]|nr:PA0069 family radical SAM protein [Candidatus Binatia bacterium]